MATKHKAPTQVTLVQEEKSAFAQWVESNWRMGAVLALVATAVILGSQILNQRRRSAAFADWDRLRAAMMTGEAAELESAAAELPPTQADMARMYAARLYVQDREYDAALDALNSVAGDNPLLSKLALPAGPDGEDYRSGIEAARALIEGQKAQETSLASKLENPPPPEDGPRVKLDTSLGEIVIALFPEQAPLHVENFLARVDEGYYADLKFHMVQKGAAIQTGDPNTREGEPETWGQGGPEETIESEAENGLIHAPYAVAMARTGVDPNSSGSQFYVTLGRQHYRDGDYTVFGVVVDPASREVLDLIGEVPVEGNRPTDPPIVRSATRL